MSALLEVNGLTKQFGDFTAVDGIDFTVRKGEVLGFLGPNGAGKTTAMRMVTGYLPPTAGDITIAGFDVEKHPIEVKRRVGYLPEGAPLYEDMTPLELLGFVANVREICRPDRKRVILETAERVNIQHVINQTIGTLSKGYKRRVGIAQAILHDPDVLILDEPTDGLDPNQKHEVRNLINEMAPTKSIVISTHILEEVDVVCSRAIVIAGGRIVANGTPQELESKSRFHNAVRFRISGKSSDLETTLTALPNVAEINVSLDEHKRATITAFPIEGVSIINDVNSCLRDTGIIAEEIHVERGHLDDVFRNITKDTQDKINGN